MSTVRCKFKCDRAVTHIAGTSNGTDVVNYDAEFYAVHSGSPENEKFFMYTPAGKLILSCARESVFEPGKEYYLDIIPVVDEQNGPK